MKKYYSLFLFWSLLTGLSTSCSDDNKKDPYLPTPPQVSIGNPSGQTTCLPGETIELKAILNNPLQTTFQWQLNKKRFPQTQSIVSPLRTPVVLKLS